MVAIAGEGRPDQPRPGPQAAATKWGKKEKKMRGLLESSKHHWLMLSAKRIRLSIFSQGSFVFTLMISIQIYRSDEVSDVK